MLERIGNERRQDGELVEAEQTLAVISREDVNNVHIMEREVGWF